MLCLDFHLKSRPTHQKSSFNPCRFILDFKVNSSAKYNIITKEEKDPKCPYAIYTCSTKLLSRKLNLYMYWSYTDTYRKTLVTKLDVLLNHLKISNNLISCQTQSKCNKSITSKHTKSTINFSCITYGTSGCISDSQLQISLNWTKPMPFIGKVASNTLTLWNYVFAPKRGMPDIFPWQSATQWHLMQLWCPNYVMSLLYDIIYTLISLYPTLWHYP